jgi:hypothetical protein
MKVRRRRMARKKGASAFIKIFINNTILIIFALRGKEFLGPNPRCEIYK